ncbi:MAG: type 2 periplasmic-binding domain-containing protein [Mobilitalea sp.]
MKRLVATIMMVVLVMTSLMGCAKSDKTTFDGKRVRVVIGSTSTTGDSYMIAELASRYLAKELSANLKVDAVGAGPALDAVTTADLDGSTIMMFHDMTYLGISFGAFEEKYALENMVVGPRIGQNPGSCFAASADAPYNDMVEMAEYAKANPDVKIRLSVEAGGVSHIAFIVYYQWVVETYGQEVADQMVVVVGGSTAEKSQMLWDGNTDVIFADYSSLLQYTEEGVEAQLKMKFLGLLDKIEGVGVTSYAEQGITLNGEPFVFSKDFIIYLPKDFPQELIDELNAAAKAICEDQAFIDEMNTLTYRAAYLPAADAKTFIIQKRDNLDSLIKSAPSLDDLTQQ